MSFEDVLEIYKSSLSNEVKVFQELEKLSLNFEQAAQVFELSCSKNHLEVLGKIREMFPSQWWDWVILSMRKSTSLWVEKVNYFRPTGLCRFVFGSMDGVFDLNENNWTAFEHLIVLCGSSNNPLSTVFVFYLQPILVSWKKDERKDWLNGNHPKQPHLRNIDMMLFWIACMSTTDKPEWVADFLLLGANPNALLKLEGGELSIASALLLSDAKNWDFPFPDDWPHPVASRPASLLTHKEGNRNLTQSLYFLHQKHGENLSFAYPSVEKNSGVYLFKHWGTDQAPVCEKLSMKMLMEETKLLEQDGALLADALVEKKIKDFDLDYIKDLNWDLFKLNVVNALKEKDGFLSLHYFIDLNKNVWKALLENLSGLSSDNLNKNCAEVLSIKEILDQGIEQSNEEDLLEKFILFPLFLLLPIKKLILFALHCDWSMSGSDLDLVYRMVWIKKQLLLDFDNVILWEEATSILGKNAKCLVVKDLVVEKEDSRPQWTLFKKEQAEKAIKWMSGKVNEGSELQKWSTKLKDWRKTEEEIYQKPLALGQNALNALPKLRKHFPHFGEVLDVLENHLTLSMVGDSAFSLPPLLLVGPPGTGKTFFFQQLSLEVETSYHILNVESIQGAFALIGLEANYTTASPGFLFESLMKDKDDGVSTANPILLLDEIDKGVKSDCPLEPVLLTLLESHSAQKFTDRCIQLPIDTRKVCWVATANDISQVSLPIRSRFTIVKVENPNFEARRSMAQYIYASLLKDNAWGAAFNPQLSDDVLDKISRPSGAIREMKKQLLTAAASAAKNNREGHLKEILPDDVKIDETQFYLPWDQPFSAIKENT